MEKHYLFISCEEAYQICDKSQYGESTLWEKIKLNLRYTYCKFTRAYVKRNKRLTKTVKTSNIQLLLASERQELEAQFQKLLNQQQ